MPSRRCDNGHIYDDIRNDQCPYCGDTSHTEIVEINNSDPTVPITKPVIPDTIPDNTDTEIIKPKKGTTTQVVRKNGDINKSDSGTNREVTGWLVVIEGPGKGKDLRLSYGYNSIGRSSDMAVSLDFGADSDSSISRKDHAFIAYEPNGKTFHLSHGSGKNLVYLNDQFIMAPSQLKAHDIIRIGSTVLLFVPLCGAQFDW